MKTVGYAAHSSKGALVPFHFERRNLRSNDIHIDILYCGVCHSDIHQCRDEWHTTTYPIVPGHEIVGRVIAVGSSVSDFYLGDLVAVGCMVDSCRECPSCKKHLEQYCDKQAVFTYNGFDKYDQTPTYGGYSNSIVVDKDFVLRIPKEFQERDLPGVAPLLCAGITTYSPLRYWNVGPGSKVGVVGLGGLGHMAVKLAHAMNAHVTVFTTSNNKVADAKRLGADEVLLSNAVDQIKKLQGSFNFILDTVSVPHNLDTYAELLARDGTLCLLGAPATAHPSPTIRNLIFKRRTIAGSLIGGIKETQELLRFCAEHKITSDIELIPIQEINQAYERTLKGDVKYRFVIDMSSLKAEA